MKKKICVTGGGGFIGSHLIKFLKEKGYWVRGVDVKHPGFSQSMADEFLLLDLRIPENCIEATKGVSEVYQLASDMGGIGFISKEHIASLHNSNLINTHVPWACVKNKVKKLFFSSSVCVYPTNLQEELNAKALSEKDVIPANPNEAYGWEKLIAEIRYQAYQKAGKLQTRIARFGNTYGPEGTYKGGREKAPAALCRKVFKAKPSTDIEVWGDGKAQRSFVYIDDNIKGIYKVMNESSGEPINLESTEVVSINQLAETVIKASKKWLGIKNVKGPEGTRSRVIDSTKAKNELDWVPEIPLISGIKRTYKWVRKQVCIDYRKETGLLK